MKVKYRKNKIESLPEEIANKYQTSYERFTLLEEKEYVVYAAWVYLGHILYCICNEYDDFYPTWTPSHIFEVSDNRLSLYWVFGFGETYKGDAIVKVPFLSFPK